MVLPIGDAEKPRILPVVTYALIGINTLVYLYQQSQPESFTVSLAATPYEITHNVDLDGSNTIQVVDPDNPDRSPERMTLNDAKVPQTYIPFPVWITLLTSLFLHGSPMHLAGNMLYLWIFGDNVEEVLGRAGYIVAYLGCGIAGSLLQISANANSLIPTLGASGAIAGVMGAYLVWFPLNRIRVLVFPYILEMPALLMIGGWILLQVLVSETPKSHVGEQGGVAYLAHVGGAGTGILVALFFRGRARDIAARNRARVWPEPY